MRSEDIFAMGLGLLPPWVVKSVSFEETIDGNETPFSPEKPFNYSFCAAINDHLASSG